uniref:Olfactory receptor n=1 Tax=Sphenodon punctatus TaxID=8508 RepID=A0A8D0GYC4_SPHPU
MALTVFILLGFTDDPQLRVILFVVFLAIYALTLVGNLGMVVLIRFEPRLHTPMYFFLSNLSFVDACYSSAVAPKMLVNCLAENRAISFVGCAAQSYFFSAFGATEAFLLAVMAYDRYVAICSPLRYASIMSQGICVQLVTWTHVLGFVNSLIHSVFMFTLSFCGSTVINHFFCEIPVVLQLSCSDTYVNKILLFILVGFMIMSTSGIIIISYLYIFSTILKIHSAEGRHKAFSTCTSHLASVILLFGSAAFMYLRPSSSHSQEQDKVVSVFYSMVIPMLNPLIYSFRNKEVKDALRRTMWSKMFPQLL